MVHVPNRWMMAGLVPVLAASLIGCSCTARQSAGPQPWVGSARIGDASYPIPAGARFVAPFGNDGADGTASTPWRTVRRAVEAAPSGATVVLRAGTYREDVTIPSSTRLTLQNYPGEAVWFSGSTPVGGWVSDGGDWRKDGWTARFGHGGIDGALIDPANPMAAYPDMAFIDGQPLRQVGDRWAVGPGTFWVDEAASQLWIGSDPNGRSVEASVLGEGLNVMSAGSVVRGIGFRHYATHISRLGAVKVSAGGVTMENDAFVDNAAAGLSVLAPDVVVRRNTASANGQLGIHGHRAHRMLVESNVISDNNRERFRPDASAGGIKFTETTDVTVRGNVVDANRGHGIWFDNGSHRATVVRNITRHAGPAAGIMFEMSNTALIAGNVSTNNQAGIMAGESSGVAVWNNVMIDNEVGFKAYKGYRVARAVGFTIRNNVVSAPLASSQPLLDNDDVTGSMTWRDMGWSSDQNAFYRRSSASNEFFTVLANGSGRLHYKSLAALVGATGLDRNSLATDDSPTNPYVADVATGDYRLPWGSPARGRGAPLPADVAWALGVPAGVPVNIGLP